jgi:hypothetical protein
VAQFQLTQGLRIESVGASWVAFSPRSGETLVLNDAAAAILEIVAAGPASPESIASKLATDTSTPLQKMTEMVFQCWPGLLDSGLICAASDSPHSISERN